MHHAAKHLKSMASLSIFDGFVKISVLMVLSRFLFAANQSVRGRSVWRIVRRSPRREKPREMGENADHPPVSPENDEWEEARR
jgi:hypothetical protein